MYSEEVPKKMFRKPAFVALASCTAALYNSSCTKVPFAYSESSPFIYPELSQEILRREKREQDLLDLRAKARNRMFILQQRLERKDISESKFKLQVQHLKVDVNSQAQSILYEVSDAHSREEYLSLYGCVKWTNECMSKIAEQAPIVEMGAGTGKWLIELGEKRGIDAIGYDKMSMVPLSGKSVSKYVKAGDESVLLNHVDRTLLLVAPPPTDMAVNCLKKYPGKKVIFVGEGRGGAHANDQFFDELEKEWEVFNVLSVDRYPSCFEKCFFLKRK